MADSDFAAVRAVIADTAADWAPGAERRTLDWFDALVAEVEQLRTRVALLTGALILHGIQPRWDGGTLHFGPVDERAARAANEKEARRG